MQWKDKTLKDFEPVLLDNEDALGYSDFDKYLKILERFNLIQQKNLQKMEDIRSEAISSLEKSRELSQALVVEMTDLKNINSRYENAFLEVLDVIDDMQATTNNLDNDDLKEFINPLVKYIAKTRDKLGWTIIPTENIKANLDLHYVLKTNPAPQESDKDLIMGVVRTGYRIGDRIIRKSEVVVYR